MSSRGIAVVALLAVAAAPASALGARTTYVADEAGGVHQLSVGPGGALTRLGAPLTAKSPRRLTMTPDGSSLYVTAGGGAVLQYDVAADGAATPKSTPAVAAGTNPGAIAINPAGDTVYVADGGTDRILQFRVGAGGALEPLDALGLHGAPVGLTVAPDGGSVFVTVGSFVKRFEARAGGRLDPATLTAVRTGAPLTDVALTPDGSRLYASGHAGILAFGVNGDGSLAPLPAPASAAAAKVRSLAISADGNSLYAGAGERLLQSTIAAGVLVPKDPSTLALAGPARDLAITPDARSLFAAAGDLELFDLGAGGLATRKLPGSIELGRASGLVVSPNQAPVARFDFAVAPAGSAVSFDASAASDADGSITRYDWDFGDGSIRADGGPRVAHVYARAGTYEVRLVVTDNEGASTLTTFSGSSVLGNGSPAAATTRLIQVAAPALPAQAVLPELGETVVVEPASGRVRVRLPGEEGFVRLRDLRSIPVGSLVDTRRGKTLLSSVRDRGGRVQQGHFSKGLFQVRQRRSDRYVTELVLRGEVGPCPTDRQAAASARRSRKLWGNGRGRFRTRGRYSSGAVRGTRWLVEDSCSGTLTVVRRGRVAVRDFTRDRTTVLEAGERYLARAD